MTNAIQQPAEPRAELVKYKFTVEEVRTKLAVYSDVQFDSREGYEEGRQAIAICRGLRKDVEETATNLNAEALRWQREVNAAKKALIEAIRETEDVLKSRKAAVDAEKARVKAEKEAEVRRLREEEIRREREAEEARLRAEREAEEARLRAEREAEEKRLAEERAKLAAEREEQRKREAELEAERAKLRAEREAQEAAARAERDRIEAEQRAERERMAAEERRIEEQRRQAEREEEARKLRQASEDRVRAALAKPLDEWVEAVEESGLWAAHLGLTPDDPIDDEGIQDALAKAKATIAERAAAERAARLEALKPEKERALAYVEKLLAVEVPELEDEQLTEVLDVLLAEVHGTKSKIDCVS